MTVLAVALAAASLLLYAWSYLVYPPLIARLAAAARRDGDGGQRLADGAAPPQSVEIVLSAADEEPVIAARVENLLAQDAPGPLTITVGCDGSADGTAAAARGAGGDRVRVVDRKSVV